MFCDIVNAVLGGFYRVAGKKELNAHSTSKGAKGEELGEIDVAGAKLEQS